MNLEIKIFKALSHPLRLKIIEKLKSKSTCVCELNNDIELSQPALSKHLKILKDAGILTNNKVGLRVEYEIKDTKIIDVINIVEKMIIKDLNNLNIKKVHSSRRNPNESFKIE